MSFLLCQGDSVVKYMTKFHRRASEPYTLITPDTPLADLTEFLHHNEFALGTYVRVFIFQCPLRQRTVTDYDRKFVLAVATSQDLDVSIPHTARQGA